MIKESKIFLNWSELDLKLLLTHFCIPLNEICWSRSAVHFLNRRGQSSNSLVSSTNSSRVLSQLFLSMHLLQHSHLKELTRWKITLWASTTLFSPVQSWLGGGDEERMDFQASETEPKSVIHMSHLSKSSYPVSLCSFLLLLTKVLPLNKSAWKLDCCLGISANSSSLKRTCVAKAFNDLYQCLIV